MKSFQKLALIAAFTTWGLIAIETNPGFAATFIVSNTLDSGAGSLRNAIDLANTTSGDDIIDFLLGSGPQTINLTSGPLNITSNLNINGSGANLLSVNGNNSYSFNIFNIASGAYLGISGLTITNGNNGILNYGTVSVTNSSLSNNNDGIFNYNNGTVSVTNSTLSSNGFAGIVNFGTASVTNSTLSSNGFDGIHNENNRGSVTVTNSTVTSNHHVGINNGGRTLIGNTIIAQNGTEDFHNYAGTINDLGYNLIGNGDGTPFVNGVNGNIVGTAANPVNPLLGPLADNGGPTQTLALLPGSPAIDAANPSNFPTTDQRGVTRPQGARADIGAFELVSTSPKSVPEPSAVWGLLSLGLWRLLQKKARFC